MGFWTLPLAAVVAVFCAADPTAGQRTANASGVTEPLLVDLKGDGIALTSVEDGVQFDLNGDGRRVQVAWTQRGSDDSFVGVDVDHNGRIDNGLELLGGMSPGPNGFATLYWYDGVTNLDATGPGRRPDGMLDAADAFFTKLILWTDLNHNGLSEEDELQSAAYARFVGFATGYTGTNERDAFGNVFTFKGYARLRTPRDVEVLRDVRAVRLASSRSSSPQRPPRPQRLSSSSVRKSNLRAFVPS
jgi:hypothetical protein